YDIDTYTIGFPCLNSGGLSDYIRAVKHCLPRPVHRHRQPPELPWTTVTRRIKRTTSPQITFYFTNFPTNWDHTVKKEVFSRYGPVEDVYIARRRNVYGKRFGFVRFTGIVNPTSFGLLFNTMLIGTQKITCHVARHQRKPDGLNNFAPVKNTFTHNTSKKFHPITPKLVSSSSKSNADYVNGAKHQSPPSHSITEPPKPDTNHSIIAELNSFDCASNTHNIISDEGFCDFSMKYLGGLHILIQLPDSVSVQNALTNTTFKTYFKSLIAWNDGSLLNISNCITWLSISGLPPCGSKNLSRPLRNFGDKFLYPKTVTLEGKDIYPIRVSKTEGEIDMFFNGYYLASSSYEDYDPLCEANVDEDTWWHDKVNSGKDGEADDDSRDKIDESVGCTNPTREGHKRTQKPNNHLSKLTTKNKRTSCNSTSLPTNTKRSLSLSRTHRPRRFTSLKLFDPFHATQSQPTRRNRPQKLPTSSSQPSLKVSHPSSIVKATSDSMSNIARCNLRILTHPRNPPSSSSITPSSSPSSTSSEVHTGTMLGFNLQGKKNDVASLLNNGDCKRVMASLPSWENGLILTPLPYDCGLCTTRSTKEGQALFSDHSSLLLTNSCVDFGPSPFKFYNSWLLHKDFPSIFLNSWLNSIGQAHPHPAVNFKLKLQALKSTIKSWRSSVKLNESTFTVSLRNTIDPIDTKAEISPLTTHDIENRTFLVNELMDLEHHNLKDLRQKAKVRWALEGDENTRFFHGIINNNRNRCRINGLNILGAWVTDHVSIKNHIFNSFESKCKEPNTSRPAFTSNLFKHLSCDEVQLFDQPFTSLEIKEAVWDCGGDKSSGPDGFTFKLIKKYYDSMSHDIISYVKHFDSFASIPKGCNSSFITLIPKTDDPLVIGDFRPISLIGCQYKIIAKILANRLALVIPSVMGEVQMAFIKGRQIIDGPLMVDEIISWAKRKKKKLMFLKVDFEKAFDTLNWFFLMSVMEQMGFSSKWRNWIFSCLDSAYASVLVNGSPISEF
ncbi:RNA-directed DNA polymerase, eukaryota, partial [Tanacetum coccineum]